MTTPWMTLLEEASAVQRAAARARCRVRALVPMSAPGLPARLRGQLECADGWAAARLLLGLSVEDSLTAGARDFALQFRRGRDDAGFAQAVQAYVQQNVAFVREPGEVFQGSWYTLGVGAGDCDDHARLVLATLRAGGAQGGLAFFYREHEKGRGPSHVCPFVFIDGQPIFLETTIAAGFGESPFEAAFRLGVIKSRNDIAQQVTIMADRDLPPLPAGFIARNPPELVAADAAALTSLGFLCDASQVTNAGDPVFRSAVLAFQLAHGLTPDGLTGPATRNTLEAVTMGAMGAVSNDKTSWISSGFLSAVARMAERFQASGAKASGEDFLAVWLVESGVRNIQNGAGAPAYGLNQLFAPKDAKTGRYPVLLGVGFKGTPEEFLALSLEDQLPYVEHYYLNATGGRLSLLSDVGSLYLVNFLPAYIGHANEPGYVLARKSPDDDGSAAWRDAHKGDVYAWNRAFDYQNKGTIVVSDLKAAVGRAQRASEWWPQLRARYYAESGDDGSGQTPRAIGSAVATGIILAISTGLASYITVTS